MSYDPRAIANAVLDEADRRQIPVTNLALNKILFFAHADHLALYSKPLISLSFEAWEFGPVVPIIYHQFKLSGAKPITTRATKISLETGQDEIFSYENQGIDDSYIEGVVSRYGKMSAAALVALSHAKDGPWHCVWTSQSNKQFGMTIPDTIIAQRYLPSARGRNGLHNVH